MESTIISWEGSFIFYVFQIDDPLEQAIKFLKPLQLLAADRIETHICAYEIYSRKGKYHSLKLVKCIKTEGNTDFPTCAVDGAYQLPYMQKWLSTKLTDSHVNGVDRQ